MAETTEDIFWLIEQMIHCFSSNRMYNLFKNLFHFQQDE